jgi:CMP-N,N'-diacetyllegionaminic acid synthase
MQVLGIIPARAGSKGLPGKHLRQAGGRPLIDWTFAAARGSRMLTRTILTTDDEQVAAHARRLNVDVPFIRPAALARDDTPMLDVLEHAISETEKVGPLVDLVVLLQPTSPLRTSDDIDTAVNLLITTGVDSVVTVMPVPHQFNPTSVMIRDGDALVPFAAGTTATRRQDKPDVVARNGPAVLAVRRDVLIAGRTLYGARVVPLEMDAESSVDVDTEWDLAVADLALRRRAAPPA